MNWNSKISCSAYRMPLKRLWINNTLFEIFICIVRIRVSFSYSSNIFKYIWISSKCTFAFLCLNDFNIHIYILSKHLNIYLLTQIYILLFLVVAFFPSTLSVVNLNLSEKNRLENAIETLKFYYWEKCWNYFLFQARINLYLLYINSKNIKKNSLKIDLSKYLLTYIFHNTNNKI